VTCIVERFPGKSGCSGCVGKWGVGRACFCRRTRQFVQHMFSSLLHVWPIEWVPFRSGRTLVWGRILNTNFANTQNQCGVFEMVNDCRYAASRVSMYNKPPPPNFICNRCNQSGHWPKQCPMVGIVGSFTYQLCTDDTAQGDRTHAQRTRTHH
jgi:hypothetical protein